MIEPPKLPVIARFRSWRIRRGAKKELRQIIERITRNLHEKSAEFYSSSSPEEPKPASILHLENFIKYLEQHELRRTLRLKGIKVPDKYLVIDEDSALTHIDDDGLRWANKKLRQLHKEKMEVLEKLIVPIIVAIIVGIGLPTLIANFLARPLH